MACSEKNPLVREGTSTGTRTLPALSPLFAKVDERQTADLLLFLRRYAAHLQFFNASNAPDGDWQPFMTGDVSVTLATLMAVDAQRCGDYKKGLFKQIKVGDDAAATRLLKYLFDLLFSLPLIVTEQYQLLPQDFDYRSELGTLIQTKLLGPVVNLHALFVAFDGSGLVGTTAGFDSNAPVPLRSSFDFSLPQLGGEWSLPSPVSPFTVPALGGAQQQVVYIINHNFFTTQVEALLKAVSILTAKATDLFGTTLQTFPSHQPHHALLLAFLKLFRIVQDELNTFTQRHLDFYDKEVLRLANKKAEPDTVHLLLGLQKPVDQHLLQKGTGFKGGKDSVSGREMVYALAEDVVLNKATVEKLQAIQVVKGAKERVIGYPVAASEDGQGAKVLSADKSWFTFGNPTAQPPTAVGFAIASNALFLKEGRRTITVAVLFVAGTTTFAESFPVPHGDFFSGWLTGSKGWLDVALTVTASVSGDNLLFSCTLHPTDPAIVPYSEKLHQQQMALDLPVLCIFLNQDNPAAYSYRQLAGDRVHSVRLGVDVEGLKDLLLSNDTGAIDAAKPFKPFGEFPAAGASFYIGSRELFQKNLTELRFEFGNVIEHDTEIHYLYNGDWSRSQRLTTNTETLSLAGGVFPPTAPSFAKNEPLSAATVDGFIRLSLNSDSYSMEQYLQEVKDQINSTTVKRTSSDPVTYQVNTGDVASPPSLVLSSFSISYKAGATVLLTANGSDGHTKFLHLTPFGYAERQFDPDQPSKKTTLLSPVANDGELLIGLGNTSPEEVVNILFHVAEGSSNPLKDFEDVKWYYLNANNDWLPLENRFVIDRTNSFTQADIVTVTLPTGISDNVTVQQKGLYWLKAAVQQNTDAVCKMILVQAGAAAATLVQDESAGLIYRQPLPASTISKPVVADGAVKTITQPFASVGGRTRETDDHFYVRVSERLRHKQRAITIWDYEHLVLERFPAISKVRCINHAGFYTGAGGGDVFCENFSGHVALVTIPDFRARTGMDPLRPYTPIGLLRDIDNYLKSICSPFVKLHVKNPQFEEVQLEFAVTFYEHLDDAFYRPLLAKEIQQYLTPWAFGGGEISFGSRIIKSAVLNFVEERPYVDYVVNFKMHQVIKRNGTMHVEEKRDVEEAVPSTARSLLVSYSNEVTKQTHLITSPATC